MPGAPYQLRGSAIDPTLDSLKKSKAIREVLLHAFNVLPTQLLCGTAYAELSKKLEQRTTVSGNGHHLPQRQEKYTILCQYETVNKD